MPEQVQVQFKVTAEIGYGEVVVLCGDHPALGDFVPEHVSSRSRVLPAPETARSPHRPSESCAVALHRAARPHRRPPIFRSKLRLKSLTPRGVSLDSAVWRGAAVRGGGRRASLS